MSIEVAEKEFDESSSDVSFRSADCEPLQNRSRGLDGMTKPKDRSEKEKTPNGDFDRSIAEIPFTLRQVRFEQPDDKVLITIRLHL
jgi:hypothetical protein